MKRFIAWVDQIRERRGLTQAELCRRAGFAPSRYSKWISGIGEPDVSQAVLIASALDVPIEFLVRFEGSLDDLPPERNEEADDLLRAAELVGGPRAAERILIRIASQKSTPAPEREPEVDPFQPQSIVVGPGMRTLPPAPATPAPRIRATAPPTPLIPPPGPAIPIEVRRKKRGRPRKPRPPVEE